MVRVVHLNPWERSWLHFKERPMLMAGLTGQIMKESSPTESSNTEFIPDDTDLIVS